MGKEWRVKSAPAESEESVVDERSEEKCAVGNVVDGNHHASRRQMIGTLTYCSAAVDQIAPALAHQLTHSLAHTHSHSITLTHSALT